MKTYLLSLIVAIVATLLIFGAYILYHFRDFWSTF